MGTLLRYMFLLLALTCLILILAAFLLISFQRPVVYQVRFIDDNTAERERLGPLQNDVNKVDVIRPVFVDADLISDDVIKSKQKNSAYDALKYLLKSLSSNSSDGFDGSQQFSVSINANKISIKDPTIKNKLFENGAEIDLQPNNVAGEKSSEKYNLPQENFINSQNDSIADKLSINEILITIKTTQIFHKTRLKLIAQTWYSKASNQTLFFSDAPLISGDPVFAAKGSVVALSKRLRVTDCPASHQRQALCCKMAWELDAFLESSAKWWCHFDDDNYVNVKGLVEALSGYDHRQHWYLGRPSIRTPLQILNRDDVTSHVVFWFATGGAGFCISRALGLLMMPVAGGGKLVSIGDRIRLPDDVTIGYVIEHLLKQKLTVVDLFHSHLENMQLLDPSTLSKQISLSYSAGENDVPDSLLSVPGLPTSIDPTRMLSLHCLLYPHDASFCPHDKPAL
ncbi:fringe glycosyltransferase [Hyalella azteca]|uniref:Fringe glycosyltransferase n=1 Tax=Hyalella azteca TaxID=294128 RepID=A0A8B7NEH9_HYAAZ|nr:fringe glycosyltransferase [Hyalella azteca]